VETAARWDEIQSKIWDCEACRTHPRVAIKIRQRTLPPKMSVSLLLVGLAPPHEDDVSVRKVAKSATNDPSDNLRGFVEETLAQRWGDLVGKGLFLIHAVKCAIVPNADGSQNPPLRVVDCCNPVGFAPEFQSLRPPRVVTLGDMARRAVLRTPGVIVPRRVNLTTKLGVLQELWPEGIPCELRDEPFILHPARFPRTALTKTAAASVIRKAAQLAALTERSDGMRASGVPRYTGAGSSPERRRAMDANVKKTVLRMIPYGLYVLTAKGKDDAVAAGTVNWVTQASFAPPLVVVGVKADSHAHPLIKESEAFALNVLGKDQGPLAFTFFKPAVRDGQTISGEPFRWGVTGAPVLERAPAAIECRLVDSIERGDHSIFVGEVVEVALAKQPEGRADDATLCLKDLGPNIFYGG